MFAYRTLLFSAISLVFATLYIVCPPALAIKAYASESLSMTLTPPLYQVSLARGGVWSSTLRFSNDNDYPLTVEVYVQNFRATDKGGVELVPATASASSTPYELALWIAHPTKPIIIPPHATENIPFTITVPENAEPGGHYAAMLVGTPKETEGDAQDLSVSSLLSSLFLVRVAGEVFEKGSIRDFSSEKWLVGGQEALMHLQFENTGNVHIEPEGEIVITNMLGRERGRMSLNESNAFGPILPASTKVFSFLWKGESNFFDIGLYRARASLNYGENKEKTAYHSAYFFVFPRVPTLFLIGFLSALTLFVRRYVRRYVASAVRIESKKHEGVKGQVGGREKQKVTIAMLREPIRGHGRRKARQSFFAFLTVLLLCIGLMGVYIYQIIEEERAFQVSVQKSSTNTLYIE